MKHIFILAIALTVSPTYTLARDDKPQTQVDACACTCESNSITSLLFREIIIRGRACRANEDGESCTHPDFPSGISGTKALCETTTSAAKGKLSVPNVNSSGNVVKPVPTKPDNKMLRGRQLQQKVTEPTNEKPKSNLPRLKKSTGTTANSPEVAVLPLTVSECTALGGDVGATDSKCTKAGQFTCKTMTAAAVNNEIVYTANYVCIDE